MMDLFAPWKKCKEYVQQAEAAYDRLSDTYEDPPLHLILLPLAYRLAADNGKEHIDEHMLILVGQYLSKKYPELKEQLMSDMQRRSIADMRQTIDSFFDEVKDGQE